MEVMREVGTSVPGSDGEGGSAERAARLREVVDLLGGNRKAARRSGVALSTLNGYLAGGGMKLGPAAQLARAAGVRLEWLATGEGPKLAEQPAPARETQPSRGLAEPQFSGAPQAGLGFTWTINTDRLVRAYEAALNGIVTPPGGRPDSRRLLQVTLLIYDDMTEAEAAAKQASPPPPKAP